MAITDYSTTPGSNTSISGINIGEGCAPANLNNAIRQQMADMASWRAGGVSPAFTASIVVDGDLTVDGVVVSQTPNAGTTGGFRLLANSVSGFAIFQVLNQPATTEWGYFLFSAAGTADWSGNLFEQGSRVWTAATLTNLNQLTNGPGYLTGINSGNVTTALGYTPANRAGDTFTGNVVVQGTVDVTSPGSGTTGGLRIRGDGGGNAIMQITNGAASAQWGYLLFNSAGRMVWNGSQGIEVNGSLIGSMAYRNVTVSAAAPSGTPADGAIWLQYV